VHGSDVVWARSPGAAGQADAVITDVPGLLIAVRTADCVPILVAGEGVVAAIHAGWRGLAAGVIPAAIAELQGRGPLTAVVGPSICMDCYEVGEEVVEGIARWVSPTHFVDRSREKPHVDGGAAAVAQLQAAGVAHVEHLKLCTRCDARLWSHREEGSAAGRQAAVVGLRC
jgi:YfiH family protein